MNLLDYPLQGLVLQLSGLSGIARRRAPFTQKRENQLSVTAANRVGGALLAEKCAPSNRSL